MRVTTFGLVFVRNGANTTVCCELILLDAGDPLKKDKFADSALTRWREMPAVRQ
jgi:hypothetical protein